MSTTQPKRVLSRVGARELTPQEIANVAGGKLQHTNVITVNPATGARDGDG
jgi:hypothetical protein